MDRREFVGGLAGALGVSGFRISNPVLSPLGIQLYTVRREAERDLDGTLELLAGIGYREVEFWRYYGRTPAQIARLLERFRLTSPSVHVPLEALEGAVAAATLAAAREIGHRQMIVASTPSEWRRTLADWGRTVVRLNRAGELAQRSGLEFAYHNHDWEFRPLEGTRPWDVLTAASSSEYIQLQLDLYWAMHGGVDPVALLRRFAGRVRSVHVKDRTADARMVDVGAGAVDWRALMGECRRAGVRHYFVEHDDPAPDGISSARASYGYLSALEI